MAMTKRLQYQTVVLPEYIPDNLGAPFQVVLKNSVRQKVNTTSGKIEQTVIPNPRGLLQRIALTRLVWPRKLDGKEIKFIRKAFSLKASDLADMIGVTPEHMSRCESGERVLSIGAEKCFRMAVLLDVIKLPEEAEKTCEEQGELKDKLERFRGAISKLRGIIKGMDIPAAHDANEELCFSFYIVKREETPSLFDDSDDDDWTDEQAIAA